MAEAVAFANQAEIISKARDLGVSTPTDLQVKLIEALGSQQDVIVTLAGSGYTRTEKIRACTLFLALEGERKARSFIIADSDDEVEELYRELGSFNINSVKLSGRQRASKPAIMSARVVVGSTNDLLGAFDDGIIEGSNIGRVLLDGAEKGILSGKLEEMLNLLHDLQNTQVVLIKKDVPLNLGSFVSKFLKSPLEVTIAGTESVQAGRAEVTAAPVTVSLEEVEHCFIELPGELLAKPNTLTDLIEGEGYPTTVVFCNSPSDADLTEVMLRKRGIAAKKLIGFISPQRAASAVQALKSKEAHVLVMTDIAAKNIELSDIELVLNHSVHLDPEIYVSRTQVSHGGTKTKRVISLITPLEIAAFHNIKKAVNVEFIKYTPPSKEQLQQAKIDNLCRRAEEKALGSDERVSALVTSILQDPRKELILGLLVHNTFEVLPALVAAQSSGRERDGEREEGRDEYNDRGGDRRGGSSDRGGDRRRGGRRGGRDFAGRDSYNEGGEAPQAAEGQEQQASEEYNSEGGGDDRRSRQREFRNGRQNTPYTPPQRDVRLYVGHGTKDGITAESLASTIVEKAGIEKDQVKRCILRDLYSFVDVPEELAPAVLEKLQDASLADDRKLFVKKATMISTPRPERREDEASNDTVAPADASAEIPAGEIAAAPEEAAR